MLLFFFIHGSGGKEAEEVPARGGTYGGEEKGRREWARVNHSQSPGIWRLAGGDRHLCFLSGGGGVEEEEDGIVG